MEVFWKLFVSVLSILSVSFLAQAERGRFPCGYDYFSEAGAWFKMHTQGAFWSEASYTCFLEGAELASPTSEPIKKAMMSLMVIDHNKNNEAMTMFIHTAMHPTDDMKNTVTRQNREMYALALTETGHLQKVSQYTTLPFICYKKAPQDLQLNECGTTDPEYKLDNRTNQCYKFHRSRNNWWSAAQSCATEGGYLAIINSEEEAQVIRDIFARNPAKDILGDYWKDTAFLGYWADTNGAWSTVQGQILSETGYEGWSPGEPNNAAGDELCGSVGRNGRLFDDPCTRSLPYICEKKIKSCVTQK